MKIEEIRNLMKSSDIAGAEAAAQELLMAESDNIQAAILYGSCRQLQGDEVTFRRIHGELAPRIAKVKDIEALEMWKHFDELCRGTDGPFLALDDAVREFYGGTVAGREEDAINCLYGCRPCVSPRLMKWRRRCVFLVAFLILVGLVGLAWWLGQVL